MDREIKPDKERKRKTKRMPRRTPNVAHGRVPARAR